MDSGVWVFLGYLAVGIILLVAVVVVYFIFLIYPKIRAITKLIDLHVTNMKKSGENLHTLTEELSELNKKFKEIFKR